MELSGARVLVAGATGVLGGPTADLDTGFAQSPVAGSAPPLPTGGDPGQAAGAVADALTADAELLRTNSDGTPVVEGRAR